MLSGSEGTSAKSVRSEEIEKMSNSDLDILDITAVTQGRRTSVVAMISGGIVAFMSCAGGSSIRAEAEHSA